MKGQTLIETILAGSLIAIIVSGISVLVVSALNNAGFAKNQSLATEYAQDGLEVLRSIRNSNYSEFAAYNNTYCLGKSATVLNSETRCSAPSVDNIDNFFIRSVKIENSDSPSPGRCDVNISRVSITVSWTDAKCTQGVYCHKSQLVSCLSTVNPVQGL